MSNTKQKLMDAMAQVEVTRARYEEQHAVLVALRKEMSSLDDEVVARFKEWVESENIPLPAGFYV